MEKTLTEEHKEDYAKLLMDEHEKGKEIFMTDDEKLEEVLLEEGIEEEEKVDDKEETDDEKLEKEILKEESLESLLGEDALIEKRIREIRINNFLMNQDYDAALSDTGIDPIMNLEEELEEIPLEEKEEEPDFSYKRLEEDDKDVYTKIITKYESGDRDPSDVSELRLTAEKKLEEQSKMYNKDLAKKESVEKKFIDFREPKRTGYDESKYKSPKGHMN